MKADDPKHLWDLNVSAERTAYLIGGYLQQSLSPAEQEELDNWISASRDHLKLFEELTDRNTIDKYIGVMQQMDKKGIRKKIDSRRIEYVSMWKYIAAAVMILLVGGAAFLFNQKEKPTAVTNGPLPAVEIKPGTDKAIITFADGTTILLDSSKKGLIRQEGGVSIQKNGEGQLIYKGVAITALYNTVSTPRGGQYMIELSDGTKAWLNSASSIQCPVSFNDSVRNVSVQGEVYFEVAKDKTKPFRVKASETTIEVLGTHFNVNSYTDEPEMRVSLLEGSVKVHLKNKSEIIRPGQQAVIKHDGTISLEDADTQQVTAWKDGYFKFNNENIVSIMRQVSRWYDVDISYDEAIRNEKFGGIVSRKDDINKLLKVMEATNTIHFKIDGKNITVIK